MAQRGKPAQPSATPLNSPLNSLGDRLDLAANLAVRAGLAPVQARFELTTAQTAQASETGAAAVLAVPTSTSALPAFPAPPIGVAARGGADRVSQLTFAGVIERIESAREAAGHGAVMMTVRHEEFGPVGLRFESDAGRISVDLSNADPEFGRAVAAAQLAALSVSSELAGSPPAAREQSDQRPTGSDQRDSRQEFRQEARTDARSDGRPEARPDGRPEQGSARHERNGAPSAAAQVATQSEQDDGPNAADIFA